MVVIWGPWVSLIFCASAVTSGSMSDLARTTSVISTGLLVVRGTIVWANFTVGRSLKV